MHAFCFSVDIWSVACILAEMNTREILFNGINSVDQVRKIINTIGMPGEEFLGKLSPAVRFISPDAILYFRL